jgi:hypothetical protein
LTIIIENEPKSRIQSPPWGPDNYRDRGGFQQEKLEDSNKEPGGGTEIRIEIYI